VSQDPWPAIATEERPWTSRDEMPRRWQSTFSGPYRAAVVPTITDRELDVSADTVAAADEASIEIARFDGEMGADVLPFMAILLRTEAAASSRIEHLTASARAIALAELGDTSRRNASEIASNTKAMTAAITLADRLDADAIIEMHAALVGEHQPNIAGSWRTQQVWIGSSSYGPHTASFVPPHHDRVPAAIDDLITFMRRDDIPVLAHAAIAHAQFETIHPFPDGNGRTGRALVHSLIRAKRLTRHVTVPVSAGLLADVDGYFDALTAYRQGDVAAIVERFADAGFASVHNGRRLVTDLRAIKQQWLDTITARRQSVVWRAVDELFRHPIVDVALLQRELGVSTPGAIAAINTLVEVGAVRQITDGRRNRLFAAIAILEALDAFAERAGRRASGG
jgi:Fic family protein